MGLRPTISGLRPPLCAAGKPGIFNRAFACLAFPVGEAGDIALGGGGLLAVFFLFIIGDERHSIFF
jgi:hypothetical protein